MTPIKYSDIAVGDKLQFDAYNCTYIGVVVETNTKPTHPLWHHEGPYLLP